MKSLWDMCWWHTWGGWLGSEMQPILKRRCMHCDAEETKPDQERIDWLNKNAKPIDEMIKELENECKD